MDRFRKKRSANRIHSTLKKDPNAIRLLYLQPSDQYDAQIRCELKETSLDGRTVYKALSYAWGDASLTLPILVNGEACHVTVNCHAALCRLREIGESCLWIDAICINQQDDREKSRQVALMRDIYHFAAEVIVWLGHAQKDRTGNDEAREKTALNIINSMSQEHVKDKKTFLQYAQQIHLSVRGYAWDDLNTLFQHPWFLRLWAHQEYTVAGKVAALMQYHVEPFDKIAEFAFRLHEALALVNYEDSFDRVPWPRELLESVLNVVQRTSPRTHYDRYQRHLRETSLFHLMSLTHRCKCSDPRDRVFAVIGLTWYEGCVGDKEGQINYSQSLAQVYTRITWTMISQSRSLQPLCFSGRSNLRSRPQPIRDFISRMLHEEDLPSWVFDWRETRKAFVENQYRASKETQLSVSFHKSSAMLQVMGVKVENVSHTFSFDNIPGESDYAQFYAIMEWVPRAEGLFHWKRAFSKYPGCDDPIEAWLRTITADLVRSNGRYVRLNNKDIDNWKSIFGLNNDAVANRCIEGMHNNLSSETEYRERRPAIDLSKNQELIEMIKRIDVAQQLSRGENDQNSVDQGRVWEQWETKVNVAEGIRRTVVGRRFFLSESGYMGFGPSMLQDGDTIIILKGCDMPLLIRSTGNNSYLVGECFVWGLMDGEGLKDKMEADYELIELR